jgi:hypothetical protein
MEQVVLDSTYFRLCSIENSKISSRQEGVVGFDYTKLASTSLTNSTSYFDTSNFVFYESDVSDLILEGSFDNLNLIESDVDDLVLKAVAINMDVSGTQFTGQYHKIDSIYKRFLDAKNKGYNLFGSKIDSFKFNYFICQKGLEENLSILFNRPTTSLLGDLFFDYGYITKFNYKVDSYDTTFLKVVFGNAKDGLLLENIAKSAKNRDFDHKGEEKYKSQIKKFVPQSDYQILLLIDSLENIPYENDFLGFKLNEVYFLEKITSLLSSKGNNYKDLLKDYTQSLIISKIIVLIEQNASYSEHKANRTVINDIVNEYIGDAQFYNKLFSDFDNFLDVFEPEFGYSRYKRRQLKSIYEPK